MNSQWLKKASINHFRRRTDLLPPKSTIGGTFFGRSPLTTKAMLETIYKWAKKTQHGVSLKELLVHGNNTSPARLVQSAIWLHQELPIRLAVQVVNLDRLPYGMCLMPSVKKVRDWYVQSFEELFNFPKIKDEQDENAFTALLEKIYTRHSPTLIMMSKGVHEMKMEISRSYFKDDREEVELSNLVEIHQFLDNFFLSRIGIRMLIGQHLELHKETPPDFVGLICKRTSPIDVAAMAIEDARFMCTRQHGTVPEVEIHGGHNLSFPYVPSHLYYILFELLKNSMRAVVETSKTIDLPPIKIIITDREKVEDIAIKVSDEGGGIRRSDYSKIWSYLYTTAPFTASSTMDEATPDFGKESPLAGLGVGLPISRLYARYFGGDLQLLSIEGYGTDAYLHLRRLGDKEEPLATPQTYYTVQPHGIPNFAVV